jgi:hypothetical protein
LYVLDNAYNRVVHLQLYNTHVRECITTNKSVALYYNKKLDFCQASLSKPSIPDIYFEKLVKIHETYTSLTFHKKASHQKLKK